jgi:hypothetical protein
MLLKLSRFVPVRFRSTYGSLHHCEHTDSYHELGARRSTWWQFRGRIFRHVQRVV